MKDLPALKNVLTTPQKSVIVMHFRPDADALGSALGLAGYLKKTGHSVNVIAPSVYPAFLNWIPGNDDVVVLHEDGRNEEAEKHIAEADTIFCLDFPRLDRTRALEQWLTVAQAKKILIDHHLDPDDFADLAYWDANASSTSGLVFDLICKIGHQHLIDTDIATCLYAGLMTDTRGFRNSSTTQKDFLIASELVKAGANPSRISNLIYNSNTLSRIRFIGFVLNKKLQVLPEYNTAYIPLRFSELKRFNIQVGDTEGLVNYGLSIEGIRLAVLLYDRGEEIKISFRSLGNFPANEIAKKHFNGGGHKNASGGVSTTTLEETLQKLFSVLTQYKNQLVL